MALYLLAHIAFRLRTVGTLSGQRLVTTALLLTLIPLAMQVAALLALAAVTTVSTVLIACEALRFRQTRSRVPSQAS